MRAKMQPQSSLYKQVIITSMRRHTISIIPCTYMNARIE